MDVVGHHSGNAHFTSLQPGARKETTRSYCQGLHLARSLVPAAALLLVELEVEPVRVHHGPDVHWQDRRGAP